MLVYKLFEVSDLMPNEYYLENKEKFDEMDKVIESAINRIESM